MSAPVVVTQFPLEKEYAKNTGVTPEDVAKLRTWLATQPHLPGDLITDLDLMLVYHCCECSPEVSKQVLDLHFTLKTHFENHFKDRIVTQNVISTLSGCLFLPLKVRAHDGSAVLYCYVSDPDPKKFVHSDCSRAVLMVLDLWQEEEGTWPGLHIIFDLKLFSLQHMAKVDMQIAQQFFYYLQEAMLVKVKALHIVNAPYFVDKLLALLRPMMKKSVFDCFFIHQAGSTTLDQHLPMDGLPKEAGGNYIDVAKATEEMQERLRLNKEFFERENRRRVVEARRPGRPKTISDVFGGVEGSFKKLDVD